PDNEYALTWLAKYEYNVTTALSEWKKQRNFNNNQVLSEPEIVPFTNEECDRFEEGLIEHGKDFYKIRLSKLSHRSSAELIQFYYFWKKSQRRDQLLRRISSADSCPYIHSTDLMKICQDNLDEQISTKLSSSASPTRVLPHQLLHVQDSLAMNAPSIQSKYKPAKPKRRIRSPIRTRNRSSTVFIARNSYEP
ncbi:hypothetical protein GJ496_008101, partial [Pomphorhynchus laevis]